MNEQTNEFYVEFYMSEETKVQSNRHHVATLGEMGGDHLVGFGRLLGLCLVSSTAIFWDVTQCSPQFFGEALRDIPKNGHEGD